MDAAKRLKKERDRQDKEEINASILKAFNTDNPEFAYICGGMRRLAVDPIDFRSRKMLLRHGIRYFSKNQLFVYACTSLLPVDLFLDIGSNYGECLFALPLYSKTKVRGFEANTELLRHLQKSITLNEDLSNLTVEATAASDVMGEPVSFFIDVRWSGKSSLAKTDRETKEIKVPTTTINNEVMKAGNVKTALLKIDVEGFEPTVIRGGQQAFKNTENIIVLLEYDSDFLGGPTNAGAFFRELRETFEIYDLKNDGLRKFDTFEQMSDAYSKKKKIHADLVLTKFGNKDVGAKFRHHIASRPFNQLCADLWQI